MRKPTLKRRFYPGLHLLLIPILRNGSATLLSSSPNETNDTPLPHHHQLRPPPSLLTVHQSLICDCWIQPNSLICEIYCWIESISIWAISLILWKVAENWIEIDRSFGFQTLVEMAQKAISAAHSLASTHSPTATHSSAPPSNLNPIIIIGHNCFHFFAISRFMA